MTLTVSTQAREDQAAAWCAALDGGFIRFYTSPRPAGPGTAITTQTLLGTCALGAPAASAGAVDGSVVFNTIADDISVDAPGGTPTWARFVKADGTTAYIDAKVALTSGGDINFDNVTWATGGRVRMPTLVFALPAGTAD